MEGRNTVDYIDRQVKPIDLIADRKLQRSVDVAFLLVSADVDIGVVVSAIGEFVNEPGIAVEIEDHRLIFREERIEIAIAQTMRVLRVRLKAVQIYDVNETDLEFR